MDDPARTSSASAKNYHAALYAGTRPAANTPILRVGGDVTWHSIDSHRSIDFNGFDEADQASYNAYTAQVFADLSRSYTIAPNSSLAPFGTLAYLHQSVDSFHESGGASALNIDGAGTDLLSSTLGLRAHQGIRIDDPDIATITHADLNGSLGWKHITGDVVPTSTARFASGSDSFTVDGAPLAHNAFTYDASFSLDLNQNASLALRYAGQFAADAQDQSLTGQFKYSF
jgi:subtilase-type serine protease